MKISNKFNIGDVVYYPAAELRVSRLLKATVTGIVITEDEGKESIVYQTGQSYGVSEEDLFKTAGPAKRRLIKILEEKKDAIDKDIKEAIKTLKATNAKEITYDLNAQYEETEKEVDETTEE